MITGYGEVHLQRMTDYEVRCSERYRRFFSLVFLAPGSRNMELREFLGDMLRRSDEYIELDGYASILMTETDKSQALHAVKRFGERQNENLDIRFSIASFPRDATNSRDLVDIANDRLEKAKRREQGAIVVDE